MNFVGYMMLEAKLIRQVRSSCPFKTKGSVIPQAEWSWSEDLANVSQGRTNVNIQSTPVEWAVRKGGGGPHLLCKA